ncbi:hypothetical protein MTZ49_07405 [Entomomonas sp. E2T0]|uniref:hypothetical protein n=1 Tax=Entomomonas sp. E2T0 TaxID=2930213 RepID=UPI00222832D4|nr:hypothetical protein [Entomomonas sp. E2T0]UYZ85365.1 hypothetical protein MTZ49_07405 [Entomomonas sp. E2T0]
MKKLLTIFSLLCCSVLFTHHAMAAPNLWGSSFAQGFIEYGIVNDKGDSIIITCNIGAGDDYDNSVAIYLASNKQYENEKSELEFVIADESYPIPSETETRSGSNAWDSFVGAISTATQFDVYVDNKKITTFSPKANNVKKVLKDMDCSSLVNRSE